MNAEHAESLDFFYMPMTERTKMQNIAKFGKSEWHGIKELQASVVCGICRIVHIYTIVSFHCHGFRKKLGRFWGITEGDAEIPFSTECSKM